MDPTIGRIVHYKLSAGDAQRAFEFGTQHQNAPNAGDVVPFIIVRVWPGEYGEGTFGVNGQAVLDGDRNLWVTSAKEGTSEGQWSWPPRV